MGVTQHVNLYLANELFPLDTRQFVGGNLPVILHVLGLGYLALHVRRPLSEKTRLLVPIAAVLVLLSCLSKRFLEYSVPATVLLCAFVYTDVSEGYGEKEFVRSYGRAGQAAALAWFIGMGAALGVEASMVRYDFTHANPPRFEALAKTLAAKAPPGELVYACDWDETPELLFFADQYRYPVIMDPTFMYYWSPDVWHKWFDVSNAKLTAAETRRTLSETFHTRFGVCGSRFGELKKLMRGDKRFSILAENDEGFVFEAL
jgi:hypothetical protein